MRTRSVLIRTPYSVRAFILIAISATFALLAARAVAANAQTAHFSYAIAALGGGFYQPLGVAVDGSGNVYVADTQNSAVKEIPAGCTSSNCVSTLGGGFSYPQGVAVDGSGNVYVADTENTAVKEMPVGCASSSCVTTLGGGFIWPEGVAVDGSGNVYVADQGAGVYEMRAGCASSSCVTALGGGFTHPEGVAVDGSGNVYIADYGHNAVKEMPAGCASSSCVTTLGGGIYQPKGVAVDGSGNVFVAEVGYTGVLYEMPAGCASSSCVATLGAGFSNPYLGVAVDRSGNVFVADYGNNAVKEIMTASGNFGSVNVGSTRANPLSFYFTFDTAGTWGSALALTQGANLLDFTITSIGTSCTYNGDETYACNQGDTVHVNVTFKPGYPGPRYGAVELLDGSGNVLALGYAQGTGVGPQATFAAIDATSGAYLPSWTNALGSGFNTPDGVAVDASGNVFVADTYNAAVKEIVAEGGYTSVKTLGSGFNFPTGPAVDGAGNVFVTDLLQNEVKEIVAQGGYTRVKTLGSGFDHPADVALDGNGNVFVADNGDNQVEEIMAAGGYTTINILGSGFNHPLGVAVDGNGNVFVADASNNAIKEILAAGGYKTVNTLGSGFDEPYKVAVDGSGNVFVADYLNSAVKEIMAQGGYTTVNTLASGFLYPTSVAVDGSGNLFVADGYDTSTSRVQKLDYADPPSLSFASTPDFVTSSDSPQTVTVSNDGNAPLIFLLPSSGKNPSVATNFMLDGSSTCLQTNSSSSTAFSLAEGASCAIAVDFVPTVAGSIAGTVMLTDNALNAAAPGYASQSIRLSGTGIPVNAVLATPAPGTVLAGPNVSFTWRAGTGATGYTLNLGSTAGGKDLYGSGAITATSASLSKLPTNGETIYARLYTFAGAVSTHNDYTFTAATRSALISPAPGTVLAGQTVTFTWSAATIGFTGYTFDLGTTAGGKDLYGSGATTVTSVTLNNLPTNGEPLYARLYTNYGASQAYTDYVYTAASKALLASPAPGTLLRGPNVTFSWNSVLTATGYTFDLGTTVGGKDLFGSGAITATSVALSKLPTNGETIYARLYTHIGTKETYFDYTFTAATRSALISPASGTVLAGPSVHFAWSTASAGAVTGYTLDLGTTAGAKDIFGSGLTSLTGLSFNHLPTNGETIYVRLYTNYGASSAYTDYVFTAASAAALTTPTPGSTLTGPNATFTWSPGSAGVTGYTFNLGTTVGGKDLFGSGMTTKTSFAFTKLPTNGETIHVRLITFFGVSQVYTDYVYTAAP